MPEFVPQSVACIATKLSNAPNFHMCVGITYSILSDTLFYRNIHYIMQVVVLLILLIIQLHQRGLPLC